MFFNFELNTDTIILLAASLVMAVLVCVVYVRRITRVSRYASLQNAEIAEMRSELADNDSAAQKEQQATTTEEAIEIVIDDDDSPATEKQTEEGSLEPASIVVYAQDEAENLSKLLPQLLKQKYAPGFEIIVVNEGASEATTDVVDSLRLHHKNLYLTYTPDGARNLSRKKLALMLGIKAARNRVIVNTTAGAIIRSRHWLWAIMRHFTDPETEVVLGYASSSANDDMRGKRRRAFDSTAAGVTWLTAAIGGHPYRGTEYNLAYTRDLFFRNKGFSRSLNLRYGDDDIFVSEIATPANTAVEISRPSIVGCRFFNPRRGHRETMRRHEFTGRFVSKASRRVMALGAWMMWGSLACAVAAGFLAFPNLTAAAAGLVIVLPMMICVAMAWRGALRKLNSRRKMLLTLPFLAMTLPLRNAARSIRWRFRGGRNYTWS